MLSPSVKESPSKKLKLTLFEPSSLRKRQASPIEAPSQLPSFEARCTEKSPFFFSPPSNDNEEAPNKSIQSLRQRQRSR